MAESSSATTKASRGVGWVALVLATSAVAGSLWLSMGMSLKACPLCLYQRSFVMCALAVLVVGVLLGAAESALACVLALPAAVAGTVVAAFHVYLEWIGKLECPAGLFAMGTAPKQSLAVLVLLSGLLLFGSSTRKTPVATLGRA
ncbi:MAG TPA: disulfide bond formation protein B, partial [Pirellulales bacterium]|nr:disulfide bond formation protein B [Pirellulales bacterium]